MKSTYRIHKEWLFCIALLALVIVVRIPAFQEPISNDIGSISYSARLIVRGEPLYGTHHPTHHLPAAYYTFALFFEILGDHPEVSQIFLIPWMWVNALVLWRIGKQFSSSATGMIAAVFFVIIGSMTNLNGDTTNIELFANLPIACTIWIGARLLQKPSHPIAFALVGIVGAISFLYKAVYLAPLAAVGGAIFLYPILENRKAAWMDFLKRSIAILASFGLVVGLVVAYFTAIGLFSRFALVFQLGTGYVGYETKLPDYYIFLIPMILLVNANPILVLLGMLGTIRTAFLLPKTISQSRTAGLVQLMILIWLIASFVEAGISKFLYYHYGLLIIPPLALIVAAEIGGLWERIPFQPGWVGFLKRGGLPILMMIAVIGNTAFTSYLYIGGCYQYLTGQISLDDYILKDTQVGIDNLVGLRIARYIEERTTPKDTIFTYTDLAQIAYLANRNSSVDMLWPMYIARLGPPERAFTSKPVYVVVAPSFPDYETFPDWLTKGLASSYRLETSFVTSYREYKIYRRISDNSITKNPQ